jgi:hypothetical protein
MAGRMVQMQILVVYKKRILSFGMWYKSVVHKNGMIHAMAIDEHPRSSPHHNLQIMPVPSTMRKEEITRNIVQRDRASRLILVYPLWFLERK